MHIKKQVEIAPTKDGTHHWIKPEDTDGLDMVMDLKEYIKILSQKPDAFIFGFFDNDREGKLINKIINIL
jgi:hypothetical protein